VENFLNDAVFSQQLVPKLFAAGENFGCSSGQKIYTALQKMADFGKL
jgi:hypothetical protein